MFLPYTLYIGVFAIPLIQKSELFMVIIKTLEKRKAILLPSKLTIDEKDGQLHNVNEALDAYWETFTKLLQEHDIKSNKQPDIEAAMHLRKKGTGVKTSKQLEPISGVKVGDEFRNRDELTIAGLHHFNMVLIIWRRMGKFWPHALLILAVMQLCRISW